MSHEITSLNIARATRDDNNRLMTPTDLMADAADEIKKGRIVGDQAVVLVLDRGPEGDRYNVKWLAANMSSSERIALFEVAKLMCLAEMEYVLT